VHQKISNQEYRQFLKLNSFLYSLIGSSARSRVYEDSIHWLTKAGIVLRCDKVNEVRNPVEFFKDNLSFKIYMSDVGLLSFKLGSYPARCFKIYMSDVGLLSAKRV